MPGALEDPVDPSETQLRADPGLLDGVRLTGTGGLTDRLWAAPAITVIGQGTPALDMGAGGSIPTVTAYAGRFPDAEILITGVGDRRRRSD